ncbi:SbcCD protein, subunit C [Pseudomonas phage Psa21]|uniref:SbcCD protein, subunit C n=1 Tax=Pseudomonas phage Psa21 TaxID=2530023 RepID=A0A481W4N1_9CAUD|nr:SbcCD protein, subunit C [Pseudomonas phage Psa21]QBJ02750.1 SbcCD protein, subunit C [Pseudomonas phage Psa21]
MYLQYVQLVKYKRLMLSNIQSLEWTPTKNLMVIIGSNGSGKSSLLDELSPLPSHRSQFEKNGSKTVHCMHKGSRYVLHSDYEKDSGTGHHTFIKDNVKLNDNGTYQIQLDLCKQEFGLQQDVHELMTGRIKFSQLPVNKRREWLTRASPVDLGYAFNLLSRVSDEARAQKNVIDHMTKRLANENVDMLDDSEITRLRQERQRLTDRVNTLFLHRNPSTKQGFTHNTAAKEKLDNILHTAKHLLHQYPRLSDSFRVEDRGEYNQVVNQRLANVQAAQAVIDRLMEELETVRATTPSQIEKISPEEIQELKERLAYHLNIAAEKNAIVQAYKDPIPLCRMGVFGDMQAKLEDAFDRAYTTVMTIPNNEDGNLSTAIAQGKKEKLAECKTKLRSIEEYISETLRRIATLKGCDHVQCPNCQHTFAPGVDPKDLPILEERLNKASQAETHFKTEIKAIEEYLEKFMDYAGFVQQFQQITRDHKDFASVWEWMTADGRLFRLPKMIATDVVRWHDAQQAMIEAAIQLENAKNIETRLKVIEAIDFDAAGYMLKRATDLETEINNKLLSQQSTRNEIESYVHSGNDVDAFITKVNTCLTEYADWHKRAVQHAEWLLDQAFSEEIDATHQQLAVTGNRLREAERRDTEIRLLEDTVADAADAHTDLQLLAKALSPKGGLIGQYMLGFLQGVTKLVNSVIDEVWTYPMVVLPSKIDKEDLDYKFPLNVGNGAVEPADIDLGSDSQKEIVNFAFSVALLKFMGFDDFPLMLDEFGRTFDEQHRTNLVPFIGRLIELGQFQQIFYISHYTSTHGAFNQAEFVVLDPTNVTVPEFFNKNMVMT